MNSYRINRGQDIRSEAEITSMESSAGKLSSLLSEEEKFLKELFSTLQRERQFAINRMLDELMEVNKYKETLILKLKVLEEGRLRLEERLAELLNISPGSTARLCELIKPPYSTEIKDHLSVISALSHSIRETNLENKSIFEYNLQITTGCLSLLSNLSSEDPTYLKSGEIRGKKDGKGVFLSKV